MDLQLNWIDPKAYSLNSLLLFERFQIRLMLVGYRSDAQWKENMGIALNANPAVRWYLAHRCPECASVVDALTAQAPAESDSARIRAAEEYVLGSVEDFVMYTTPEKMETNCDFIRGWQKERLFEAVDLTGKTVLDVGAGSGRLTFAAAEKAAWVYASEPVETLRAFMREKSEREGIRNVRVLDGFADALAFPDDTFDVVMSGHVVGDDYEREIAELSRVCKPGGWLLDCPGDSEWDIKPNAELLRRGWEELRYIGSFGKEVRLYRKQLGEKDG